MPNWVYNYLTASGEPADITAFREAMAKPYDTFYTKSEFIDGEWIDTPETQHNEYVFSFWNIVKPDESDYDEYFAKQARTKSQIPLGDPNWWNGVLANQAVSKHWYDWNNHHWGTKWDACEVEIVDDCPDTITYKFETAWGAPLDLFVNILSKQYPNLTFNHEFEEEQGWGGEFIFANGEIFEKREWDIPESHADYEAQGKYGHCVCQWIDDPQEWYDDCPNKKTALSS